MKRLIRHEWKRWIAAAMILPTLLYSDEFYQMVYAAADRREEAPAPPTPQSFEQTLATLRILAEAALGGEDNDAAILDAQAQFQADKTSLDNELSAAGAGLAGEALARHGDFVLEVNSRFNDVDGKIDAVLGATSPAMKTAALGALVEVIDLYTAGPPTIPVGVDGTPPPPPGGPFVDITLGQGPAPVVGGLDPADLLPTADAPLAPEIVDLAASLGNNPAAIFEHVVGNFRYEHYYGSRKGAIGVLREGGGNDADLASLTVALLRASGIHARLVYGTVRVEKQTMFDWLGVNSTGAVAASLSAGEFPHEAVVEGGAIAAWHVDRAWVRAHMSYHIFRGAAASPEPAGRFVDLDPSWRILSLSGGHDVAGEIGFVPLQLLASIQAQSTVTADSAANLPTGFIVGEILNRTGDVEAWLAANSLTPQQAFIKAEEVLEEMGHAPVARPYRTQAAPSAFREWPPTFRVGVKVQIGGATFESTLPEIFDKRLSITHEPASPDDATIVADNAGEAVFPAYLVNLRPVINLDGAAVATGAIAGMGTSQPTSVTITSALGTSVDVQQTLVIAGEAMALVLEGNATGRASIELELSRLQSLPLGDPEAATTEILRATALNFLFQREALQRIAATNFNLVRGVTVVAAADSLKIESILGLPFEAEAEGVVLDVLREQNSAQGTADAARAARFLVTAGIAASAVEHASLIQMLQVEAFSTVRLLDVANTQGQTVYLVDSANVGTILPALSHPSDVEADVQNAAAAGNAVLISAAPVTFLGETASGYVIVDPSTGTNRFVIRRSPAVSGGIAPTSAFTPASLLVADAGVYQNLRDKGTTWYSTLLPAVDSIGASFVPTALAIEAWLGTDAMPDALRFEAAIVSISAPVTQVATTPAIFNVAASPAVISPNADGVADTLTVTADVTQGAAWTVEFKDLAGTVVGTAAGTTPQVVATFGSPVPDGTYTFTIAAGTASPRGGAFVVDTTAPIATIELPAEAAVLSGITNAIRGTASDTNFGDFLVQIHPFGNPAASQTLSVGTSAVFGSVLSPLDATDFLNGDYTIRLTVTDDGGNVSTDEVNVSIANPIDDVEPPTVTIAAPPAESTHSGLMAVSVVASDNVGVVETRLRIDGVVVGTSPSAMPVFNVDTTAFGNCPHVLSAEAVDANGNLGFSSSIAVFFENPISAFTVEPAKFFPAPDGFLDSALISANVPASAFTIEIRNASAVLVRTFAGTGPIVSQVWDGKDASAAIVPDGLYTVKLIAAAQTAERTVEVSSQIPQPVAIIHTPVNLDEVNTLTEVRVTAQGDLFSNFTLHLQREGEAAVTIAAGTTPVANAVVATIDPTLIENDSYTLFLTVENTLAQQSEAQALVLVAGEQKVGNFTVSFQDMSVPVRGVPVQITRTYDTLFGGGEDFGPGWKFDVVAGEIRVDAAHNVFVRLPDRKRVPFRFVPEAVGPFVPSFYVTVTYQARRGTHFGLIPQGDTTAILLSGELFDLSLQPYDPPGYTVVDVFGNQNIYEVAASGTGRLVEQREPNGNRLLISDTAVQYVDPDGFIQSQTTITRDPGTNLITAITDPDGKSTTYEYDGTRLVAAIDRDGNKTEFFYGPFGRLADIKDPSGKTPIMNFYGPDGRVIAHVDADGNTINLGHNVADRRETVTDRRGFDTTIEYNADGLVTKQIDAKAGVQKTVYDADQNPIQDEDANGNKTNRTFDIFGDVLSETNPLNQTTSFTYDPRGNPVTTTNALGQTVFNKHDEFGNFEFTQDAMGNIAGFNNYTNNGDLFRIDNADGSFILPDYKAEGFIAERRFFNEFGQITRQEISLTDNNGRVTAVSRHDPVQFGLPSRTMFTNYNNEGQVLTQVDEQGHFTENIVNERGQVVEQIDKEGNKTLLVYNDRGELTQRIYPAVFVGGVLVNPTEMFEHDANGNRTEFTDRNGNVTTTIYDELNRPIKVINPDGTFRISVYDAAGRVVAEIDERGFAVTFEYDAAGRRVKTTDALGNVTTFGYDAAGRQVTVTDAKGNTTTTVYDAAGRVSAIVHPDGTVRSFGYDAQGRKVSETDENGITTFFDYDFEGRLKKVTQPNPMTPGVFDVVTQYVYNLFGEKVAQISAEGQTTTWTYTLRGEVASRTLPGGQTEFFTYTPNGQLDVHTRFDGTTIAYVYDAQQRLIKKIFSTGGFEEYEYTAAGQRSKVTINDGVNSFIWTFGYDSRNRLTFEGKPDGTFIAYGYDEAGNRTSLQTPLQDLTYAFDALNRPVSVANGSGVLATAGYDANGNLAFRAYANGTRVDFAYNVKNQLVSIAHGRQFTNVSTTNYLTDPALLDLWKLEESSAPFGDEKLFLPLNEQGTGAAPGQIGRKGLAVGFGVGSTSFVGKRNSSFGFPAGQGTLSLFYRPQTSFGATSGNLGHDASLFSTQSSATPTATQHLVRVDGDGSITVSDGVTALGSAAQEWSSSSWNHLAVTWSGASASIYKDGSLVASGANPFSQTATASVLIGNDQSSISAIGFSGADGRIDEAGLFSGALAPQEIFDLATRGFEPETSDIFRSFVYSVDAAGRRTGVLEEDGRTVEYFYDLLNRLIAEKITEGATVTTFSYTYDKVGNRLAKTTQVGAATTEIVTYSFNVNDELVQEVSSVSGTKNYFYLPTGETASISGPGGTQTFGWDLQSRLVSFSGPGGTGVAKYDAEGIRWQKIVGAQVTTYLVDRNQPFQQVLEERDGAGAVTASYVYLDDLVAAAFAGVGTRFYGYDGQMSTRFLTDGAAQVTDSYTFDAFGVALASAGATPNNYLYTGEQFDPNLGLQYNRARYLSSSTGRWLSHDPFRGVQADPISLHKYIYASQDSVGKLDPSGQLTLLEILAVVTIRLIELAIRLRPTIQAITLASCVSWAIGLLSIQILETLGFQPSESDYLAAEILGIVCIVGLALLAATPERPRSASGQPPSAPVGRKGAPLDVRPGTNRPAVINGRPFSGHALDRMQGRGFTPSVVNNAIRSENIIGPGNSPGTTVFYDAANNISVIVNDSTGVVITIGYGRF